MQDKRHIICGDAMLKGVKENPDRDIRLRLSGRDGPDKITLRIEDIHTKMFKSVPQAFHDLLEIATYVYCADQAIKRGADDVDSFGEGWRRDLHFIIPVRRLAFWSDPKTLETLQATLGFLSDDHYRFDFVKIEQDHKFQDYLEFNDEHQFHGSPEQVVMFSGGLDSLAGAIDEVLTQKRRVVLVTHKSTPKLNTRHRTLAAMLAQKAPDNPPIHIGVRVNKSKALNREYTQRTRSFLFVSIGATIANMLGHKNVRFYENGVVSLNLPVCAQVVGGRATRTTHPRVMKGFEELMTLVADEPFTVENPFIWKTKADVVEVITKAGCQDLIAHSMTCTHTWEMTNQHTHCGGCSQCIDRRFAMVAAKADQFDPIAAYKTDVFTQSRDKGADKIMAAAYLERANQVKSLTDLAQFIASHSEVSRVFRYLDGSAGQVAQRTFDLYKRHANEVCGALDVMIERNITAIRERTLPGDSLLRIVYESGSVISVPAVAVTEKRPDNYFRRRGGVWVARFQGKNDIFLQGVDKGAAYINILLAHPGRETSVFEIVCGQAFNAPASATDAGLDHEDLEEGFQVTSGVPLGDAGIVADHKAVAQYRGRYKELIVEKADAEENSDHERLDEIEDELSELAHYITGAVGRGGKLRKTGDKRKNVRDAFRNAINRAILQIAKYDKPLAEHLKKSIKHGNEVVYRPEIAITWEVRPVVNE